jgi:hypothetical protein
MAWPPLPTRDEVKAARAARHVEWEDLLNRPRPPSAYDQFRRGDGSLNFRAMEDEGFDIS